MTWLVMIGLPCLCLICFIRSVLVSPNPGKVTLGDRRPLLTVPMVALLFFCRFDPIVAALFASGASLALAGWLLKQHMIAGADDERGAPGNRSMPQS